MFSKNKPINNLKVLIENKNHLTCSRISVMLLFIMELGKF